MPAPVHELKITRSEARWASVSWKLPTAPPFSHVTELEISVYRNSYLLRRKTISRGTQFIITGLYPNTEYRVGIRTRDVSRWSTKVIYERFKTKEAGATYGFFQLLYIIIFISHCVFWLASYIRAALDFVYRDYLQYNTVLSKKPKKLYQPLHILPM